MSAGNKLLQAAAGVGGEAEDTDPDFANTVLLLNGDDAPNGGQNNTFLDSSSNAHTITRNGNVTQGSFSPFSVDEGKWGNYFDGVSDNLNVANDASFQFGTDDFTVEAWVYQTAISVNSRVIFKCSADNSWDSGWSLALSANGSLPRFWVDGDIASYFGDDVAIPLNEWTHVAVARSGTTLKAFINGTEVDSDTNSANIAPTAALTIGADITASAFEFYGYISNLRIVKGTALYTSSFTPPTTPLTDVSGTSLLTCQSNRFVDNSSNAHSITVNGDTKVVPFSPFPQTTAYDASTNGGSAYFDGLNDELTISGVSAIGTSDFTIEFWLYTQNVDVAFRCIYDNRSSAVNSGIGIFQYGQEIEVYGSGLKVESSATALTGSAWHHIALVRNSNSLQIYVNGVASGSSVSDSFDLTQTSHQLGQNFSGSSDFVGYLSDFREVTSALYTSNFTPPTAPLTDITNTSLLCNFTNASIKDATGRNLLETVGNAQVDTTTFKYGTGAMEFGDGNRLESAPNIIYSPEDGDFTIEAWLYNQGYAGTQYGRGWCTLYQTGLIRLLLRLDSSTDKFNFFLSTTGSNTPFGGSGTLSTGTCTPDTWVHAAFVRESGTFKFYIDGTLDTTISGVTDSLSGFDKLRVGSSGSNDGSTPEWNGYIDDFRFTKGIARYTANFTPPERALPVIGEE